MNPVINKDSRFQQVNQLRLKNRVWVNGVNLNHVSAKEKLRLVQVSGEFELTKFD